MYHNKDVAGCRSRLSCIIRASHGRHYQVCPHSAPRPPQRARLLLCLMPCDLSKPRHMHSSSDATGRGCMVCTACTFLPAAKASKIHLVLPVQSLFPRVDCSIAACVPCNTSPLLLVFACSGSMRHWGSQHTVQAACASWQDTSAGHTGRQRSGAIGSSAATSSNFNCSA